MKLYLSMTVALGFGTRPKGLLMGTSAAKRLADLSLDNVTPAEGIHLDEIGTLLENLQIIDTRAPESVPEESTVEPFSLPKPTVPGKPPGDDSLADPPEGEGEEGDEESDGEGDDDLTLSDKAMATTVAELKLSKALTKKLADAGLTTVQQLVDYADSHEGLTSSGITSDEENKVRDAIQLLLI